jgi:hypothetical protein
MGHQSTETDFSGLTSVLTGEFPCFAVIECFEMLVPTMSELVHALQGCGLSLRARCSRCVQKLDAYAYSVREIS